MSGREPALCVALDAPELTEATRLVDALAATISVFKVGLELFCAAGPAAVREVRARGVEVFLDMKINDIPKQASGAVRSAAASGASYVTVHANGGRAMVEAAVEAAGDAIRVLVVSVLTSLDDPALREIGIQRPVGEQVEAMAELAASAGAPGLVLSPREVAAVRKRRPELFLVTPGIRPADAAAGDQRRTGTPGAAVADGADLLVVGRPITASDDPVGSARAILDEIDAVRGPQRVR